MSLFMKIQIHQNSIKKTRSKCIKTTFEIHKMISHVSINEKKKKEKEKKKIS